MKLFTDKNKESEVFHLTLHSFIIIYKSLIYHRVAVAGFSIPSFSALSVIF